MRNRLHSILVIFVLGVSAAALFPQSTAAVFKVIEPRAGASVGSENLVLRFDANLPMGGLGRATVFVNQVPWCDMGSGSANRFFSLLPASTIGYGSVAISGKVSVNQHGGIVDTVESDSVTVKLSRGDWTTRFGGGTRNSIMDDSAATSGAISREWITDLAGIVESAPISDGSSLYYLIDRDTKPVLVKLALDTGRLQYSVPIKEAALGGFYGAGLAIDRVEGILYAMVRKPGSVRILGIDPATGETDFTTEEIPFAGVMEMLPYSNGQKSALLVAGFAPLENGSMDLDIFSIDKGGYVQLCAVQKGADGSESRVRGLTQAQLVWLPGNSVFEGPGVAVVAGRQILAVQDPLSMRAMDQPLPIKVINISRSTPRQQPGFALFSGSGLAGALYFAFSDGYWRMPVKDASFELEQVSGSFAQSDDSFSVLDGRIYHFLTDRGSNYVLEARDSVGGGVNRMVLSVDSDYSERYFLNAFDCAPLVGRKFVVAIDRNYALFVVNRQTFLSDEGKAMRTDAPEQVVSAKKSIKRLPFGRANKSGGRGYFRQPDLVTVGPRIIVTTGEEGPNFAICYRMR